MLRGISKRVGLAASGLPVRVSEEQIGFLMLSTASFIENRGGAVLASICSAQRYVIEKLELLILI